MPSRRTLLQTIGGSIALGSLAGLGNATDKPSMRWDSAHYSNYENANRSASDVRWIVLHTIEGSASSAINWFQNPDADVSSHFVVDSEGEITKMVNLEDVAWTQGNGEYNDTGISIEMEGYANETDFSEAMYESVGQLVAYLCEQYDVPKRHPTVDIAPCSAWDGQGGIVGHEQIPSPHDCSEVTGGKVDPGSTWDWDHFMEKVGGSTGGGGGGDGSVTVGDTVTTTANVNVRSAPTIGDNVKHTNPEDVRGVVREGPKTADGYTWWHVEFENGVTGWSVQTYLDHAAVTFLHDQRVKTTADLVVHDEHSLRAADVWVAPEGSAGYTRAGPQQADGYTWWKVAFNSGHEGWCVEEYLDPAPFPITNGDGETKGAFEIGEKVHPTTDLNVRENGTLSAADVGTVSPSDVGWVKNGYVSNDGYTWWEIDWQDGPRGWSVEEYMESADGSGGADRDSLIETVPYYNQYDNDIAPGSTCQNTAIAMILGYHGWGGEPDRITREWDSDSAQTPEGGEKVFNDVASDVGLAVRANGYRKQTMGDLESSLDDGVPVIVYGWFTDTGHVVTAVDYDDEYVYVHDPAGQWNEEYKGDFVNRDGDGVAYDRDAFEEAVSPDGYVWMVVPSE